eukprot:g2018.t1
MCVAARNGPMHPPTGRTWSERFIDLLRLLKSSGVNSMSMNNVNGCGKNAKLLESEMLRNVSASIGPLMHRYGIRPYFSACYASPFLQRNISCDPLNPAAIQWWKAKTDEIYKLMPNFGGFVVKADSEGNQGPIHFNRTEAQGANLLARALKPHGGLVLWRAFVYGLSEGDRAKQAWDIFMPLDGKFDENVIVQIKNGPMDFKVREPLSPLFGTLKHTKVVMEVQAAQEYTGHQIHAMSLLPQWKSYLDFDTQGAGVGTTVGRLLSGRTSIQNVSTGMCAVSNVGDFANWTGSVLSAVNIYGFGRLSWEPEQTAAAVNREFASMVFGSAPTLSTVDRERVESVVTSILQRSWSAYEAYTSPLGTGCGVIAGGTAGGYCAPDDGKDHHAGGALCPTPPQEPGLGNHYWLNPCSDYGYSNASEWGLGCDRTSSRAGTGFSTQYTAEVQRMFDNVSTCPTELLLFFHNLPWDHPIPGGQPQQTLLEYIEDQLAMGLADARQMARDWASLNGSVSPPGLFDQVGARFAQQLADAAAFASVVGGYYRNVSRSGGGGGGGRRRR